MTEQELEKLFKSKLASGNYQYNPAAWHAMENILDQNASRGGWYFWRSAAAILAFAFLLGAINFWQTSQMPPATTEQNALSPQLASDQDPIKPKGLNARDHSELNAQIQTDIEQSEGSIANAPTPTNPEIAVPARDKRSENATNKLANSYANNPSDVKSAVIAMGINEQNLISLMDSDKATALLNLQSKDISYTPSIPSGTLELDHIPNLVPRKYARQGVFIKGGTLLNEAYHDSRMGVGFHLGIEYHLGLAKNLDLSAGLNYSRINKVGIHQQFDSTFYHFSSERIETEITGQQLSYLEMPLTLNWCVLSRHQFGAGAYASLLLSVSEEIETRHYNQNGEVAVEQDNEQGRLYPYETYDFGLAFSYFYRLDPQWEIGVEFRRGLTDITKDTESVYVANHQNLNTRLSLRYRIL